MKKNIKIISSISQDSQYSRLRIKSEAEKIFLDLKKQIAKLKFKPILAVILVGHDPASKIYVGLKEKRAKELGVGFIKHHLSAGASEKKIIALIQKLNDDKKITGIMVQLPLPKKFNPNKIIAAIKSEKDADGLNNKTQNSIPSTRDKTQKKCDIISPAIQSILHLIKLSKQKLIGKKAVILCHSQEFAEPLKQELEKKKIKVSLNIFCHSQKFTLTHGIPACAGMTQGAEVIVVAIGKKHFLKPEMIKKDAVIIDVGINKIKNKVYGDVNPICFTKTKYISPVPGGVGPLTVAYLFKNLITLSKIK